MAIPNRPEPSSEGNLLEPLSKVRELFQKDPLLGERALGLFAAMQGLDPEALRPLLTSRRERAREAFQAPTCATSRRTCPATPTPRTTRPRGSGS